MYPISYSLLVHFIGIGMIFTALFSSWTLGVQYRKAPDWPARLQVLRAIRALGLFSPVGALILLLSGIGNMMAGGYSIFSASWLSVKLVFFLILAALGIVSGIRGARRGKIAASLAKGTAAHNDQEKVDAITRQLGIVSLVQAVIILIILMLSIVKPLA